MFDIRRYTTDMADEWNQFVARSKNGTFLFHRGYMDYHQDRFVDHSIVFFLNNRIFAILPANVVDGTLYSHQGLTYGGLVMDERCTGGRVCQLFTELNAYLSHQSIGKVVYKAIPSIYHLLPSEEDLYAIAVQCHGILISRDLSSTIVLNHPIKFPESRRAGIRKARANALSIHESQDISAFWEILNANLLERYDVKPVHTKEELQMLQSRFPDAIKLYMVYENDTPLGGAILYLTRQVAHVQYISASHRGKECGALDLLFDELVHRQYDGIKYFDFGKSTTQDYTQLNLQLLFQKEGFGGRGICYDTYQWNTNDLLS